MGYTNIVHIVAHAVSDMLKRAASVGGAVKD